MSYSEWKDKTAEFKKIDVRGIQGNFFAGIKKQAMQLPAGQGMEIGPSTLFAAYKTIKNMEKQGKERGEICETLKEKFGEKNPDVRV